MACIRVEPVKAIGPEERSSFVMRASSMTFRDRSMCRASTSAGLLKTKNTSAPFFHRLPDGADHRGGLAAFGNRHQDVAGLQPVLSGLLASERHVVLETLDRADEGEVAAGHDARHAVFEIRQLGGDVRMLPAEVLPELPPGGLQKDAQAARRAAAGEADVSFSLQRSPHGGDHSLELRPGKHLSRLGQNILVDRLQHPNRRRQVPQGSLRHSAGFGMRLFGRQHSQMELLLLFDELFRLAMGLGAGGVIEAGCGAAGGGGCQRWRHEYRLKDRSYGPA